MPLQNIFEEKKHFQAHLLINSSEVLSSCVVFQPLSGIVMYNVKRKIKSHAVDGCVFLPGR